MIRGLIRLVIVLVVLAGIGLVGYAYVGPVLFPADFAAPSQPITTPVTLGGS